MNGPSLRWKKQREQSKKSCEGREYENVALYDVNPFISDHERLAKEKYIYKFTVIYGRQSPD